MKKVASWPKAAALPLALGLGILAGGCGRGTAAAAGATASPQGAGLRSAVLSGRTYAKPSDEVLRQRLSSTQYSVTQNGDTEPPFRNAYYDNHQVGLYVDVATGEPLFSSTDKFESGTGWPSFTRPVEPQRVVDRSDRSFGWTRTEVRSKGGDSHLGHVFEDGPEPTGLRYCINSAAIRFVPVNRLAAEGYGPYLALFQPADKATAATTIPTAPTPAATIAQPSAAAENLVHRETAILAGGCFWGMEEILRKVPGVLETQVGYAGGTTKAPTYAEVSTGETGHAEAVRVVFDPRVLSYADLLEKWFFRMHDPTTRNRQENDVGTQYRSAIFVSSAQQREIAEAVRTRVDRSGKWKRPIVTEIVPAGVFTPAEEHHQKYLQKNPGGYMCHFLRD